MTRTIEIDFEVHKLIESERRDFDEPKIAALRRLLGLDGEVQPASGRPWSGKGVILEHGTECRMEHNGRQYTGRIDNGDWLVEGQRFGSPSGATKVATTKAGAQANLDGWLYWQVRRPGTSRWRRLRDLRNGRAA